MSAIHFPSIGITQAVIVNEELCRFAGGG